MISIKTQIKQKFSFQNLVHQKNIQFIHAPEYNLQDENFVLTSDNETHATLYTGHLSFINISNPAQKYLVVDSSVNLQNYSSVDKIFKENMAKVKIINPSEKELRISAMS